MTVKILLFDLRVCWRVCRHGTVGSLIRVKGIIPAFGFCPGFQLPDLQICILGIVFRNVCFQTCSVKYGHGGLIGIDLLKDRFCKVNEGIKECLQVVLKILFKPGDLWCIRNFIKAAEFPQILWVRKESQKQGISRDGKDLLNSESPEQRRQFVFPGSAGRSIKMVQERNRDHFIKVNGRFEQFQEFRFVRFKNFLGFCKNISQWHLLIWYHRCSDSFLGHGWLFLDNSILPWTSEELFYFVTKRMP